MITRTPCPTCVKKDVGIAQIAGYMEGLNEQALAETARANAADARATTAEQERNSWKATALLSIERYEAAEQREAEKDKALREIYKLADAASLWTFTFTRVGTHDGTAETRTRIRTLARSALASPST